MLLLVSLALADDMVGVCATITTPADAHGYADIGALGTVAVGEALIATADAWLVGDCVEEDCTADGVPCERTTCTPEAGVTAVLTVEDEVPTRDVTRADGEWTWLAIRGDARGWSAAWAGLVDADLAADSEARGSTSISPQDDLTTAYSERWTDPNCAWQASEEVGHPSDTFQVRVTGQPEVEVRFLCTVDRVRVWTAELDGVALGPVDPETWDVLHPGAVDADGDGFPVEGGDCDDADARISPCATHDTPGDGVDQDCDGEDPADTDGDGDPDETDCDDSDPTISTLAFDQPYDGIDQDCDGADVVDVDGDGFPVDEDCHDGDDAINPGAWDFRCDGIDQDCDGVARCDEEEPPATAPRGCRSGGSAWLLLALPTRRRRRT